MEAIRRFFRRFSHRKTEPAPGHLDDVLFKSKTKKTKKSDLDCRVTYLDGTEQTFYLPKNANASELFDIAFAYVAIVEEKDYFGLKLMGKNEMWLDPTKGIRHQCKANPPYSIALKVKFFASDPHNLRDEYTRYLVVLQLRDDIRAGHLPCADMRLAAELAALLLQAEFGDFDPRQHTPVFVSTFRFLPEDQQTEEFELSVLDEYRALNGRNLTVAEAEAIYLEKASHIPDYGVDKHTVKGKNDLDYMLGLTPAGILVYEGSSKIGLFFWSMILSIEMKRKKLEILVAHEDEISRNVTEHFFRFFLPDNRACKSLWKSAVEYHTFFRRTTRSEPAPKRSRFFRLRSRFQASFNTEYQLHYSNLFGSSSFRRRKNKTGSAPSTPVSSRPDVSFNRSTNTIATPHSSSFRRVPSKRFSSRPSFVNRSLDERRATRHRIPEPKAKTQADVFGSARAVVNAERECLRDPNWTPTLPESSAPKSPFLRSRPAPQPPSASGSPTPPVVRVGVPATPGSRFSPSLQSSFRNHPSHVKESDQFFEATV